MAVSIEDIKKLKELTGVGLTDAKQALVEAEGDFDKALERYDKLRVKHTAKVIKRSRKIGKVAQKRNKLIVNIRNSIMKMMPNAYASSQATFLYKSKEK